MSGFPVQVFCSCGYLMFGHYDRMVWECLSCKVEISHEDIVNWGDSIGSIQYADVVRRRDEDKSFREDLEGLNLDEYTMRTLGTYDVVKSIWRSINEEKANAKI